MTASNCLAFARGPAARLSFVSPNPVLGPPAGRPRCGGGPRGSVVRRRPSAFQPAYCVAQKRADVDYGLYLVIGCLLGLGIGALLGTLVAWLRGAYGSFDPDEPSVLRSIAARCLDAIRSRVTALFDTFTLTYRERSRRQLAHSLLTATPSHITYRLSASATRRPGPASRPPAPAPSLPIRHSPEGQRSSEVKATQQTRHRRG